MNYFTGVEHFDDNCSHFYAKLEWCGVFEKFNEFILMKHFVFEEISSVGLSGSIFISIFRINKSIQNNFKLL